MLLLALARDALTAWVTQGASLERELDEPRMREPRDVFASLYRGRLLRGCIGCIGMELPLYRAVADMVIGAAAQDPRFEPVRSDELGELRIELSVLGPARPVAGLEEIRVGQHGVVVARGAQRGVLLPQVALEYRWDAAELFAQACRKAGIAPQPWGDAATRVEVFEAQVFGEPVQRRRS